MARDVRPAVFVSRPAVLSPPQTTRYEACLRWLDAHGLSPSILDREDYAATPWAQLRARIAAADGAVILGFRQTLVADGTHRPDTAERAAVRTWLGTPWNQVETGLAVMAGIPVLVVPERDVREGIFAPDCWGGAVRGVALEAWSASEAAEAAARDWLTAVRDRGAAPRHA